MMNFDFLYNGAACVIAIFLVPVGQRILWKTGYRSMAVPVAVLMYVPAVLSLLTSFYFMYGETGALERWEITFGACSAGALDRYVCSLILVAINVAIWLLFCRIPCESFRGNQITPLSITRPFVLILSLVSAAFIYLANYQTLERAVELDDVKLAARRLEFNLAGIGPNDGVIRHFGTSGLRKFPLLPLAVKNGNKEMIALLLDNGAELNPSNWNVTIKDMEDTPLTRNTFYFAVINDDLDLIEFLLLKGADPTQGVIPAVEQTQAEILRLFLEKGADIDFARNEARELRLEQSLDRMLSHIDGHR